MALPYYHLINIPKHLRLTGSLVLVVMIRMSKRLSLRLLFNGNRFQK